MMLNTRTGFDGAAAMPGLGLGKVAGVPLGPGFPWTSIDLTEREREENGYLVGFLSTFCIEEVCIYRRASAKYNCTLVEFMITAGA